MEWMFASLTTICNISPVCHSFITALQLGLLDCHNSTRKCWNKLVCITCNEVCIIIHQGLENIQTFSSRPKLLVQDQDQYYFSCPRGASRPRPRS